MAPPMAKGLVMTSPCTPPVFVFAAEGTDASVYDALQAAELDLEPPDVKDVVVFDSVGHQFMPTASGRSVRLKWTQADPDIGLLVAYLNAFLEAIDEPGDVRADMSGTSITAAADVLREWQQKDSIGDHRGAGLLGLFRRRGDGAT